MIGGFLIVGEQRSDLESLAARPQNAVALQPSLIDDAKRDSLRLPDPGLEEFCARGGEGGLVVAQDFLDRDRCEFGQAGRRRASAPALLADIAEREPETRLAVVVLLGDDPVETDHAIAQMVQGGPPQFKAKALPAMLRLDDVEAQESKPRAVADGGDAADRNAIKFGEKEPLRIRGVEAMRVMKAGIPALGGSPFEGEREISFGHPAQNETLMHGAFPQLSFAAATSPSVT